MEAFLTREGKGRFSSTDSGSSGSIVLCSSGELNCQPLSRLSNPAAYSSNERETLLAVHIMIGE